jgi:ATP-dependent Clp protease ATP-binding subunit ClpA
MINRFSTSARAAVSAAVEEAGRRGDPRVGTEHLLLGLLHDAESPASRAMGVDLDGARHALDAMDSAALAAVGLDVKADVSADVNADPVAEPDPGADDSDKNLARARSYGRRPFTRGAGAALRRTLAEAQARSTRRLEPTHLLLALLDGGPRDPATALLARLGIDPSAVRSRLSDAA